MQMGSFTGTSNANGQLSVSFNNPFPISIDSVLITNAHADADAIRGILDNYTQNRLHRVHGSQQANPHQLARDRALSPAP
jgi:hypothetical protein